MEQGETDNTQSGQMINIRDPGNSSTPGAHYRPGAGTSSQTSNEQSVVVIPTQPQTNAYNRSVSSTKQQTFPVIQLNADTNQTALEFFRVETGSSSSCHVGTVQNIIPSKLQRSVSSTDGDDLQQTVIPAFIVVSKKLKPGNEVICIDDDEENSSDKKGGNSDQSTKAALKTTHLIIQPLVGQGSISSQALTQTQTMSTGGAGVSQQPPITIPQSSDVTHKLSSSQPNPVISAHSSKQTTKDICKIGNIDTENVPSSTILSGQTGSLPLVGSLCRSKDCADSSLSITATDKSLDRSRSTSPEMCNIIQKGIPLIGNSENLRVSNSEMLKEVSGNCKVCGEVARGSPFGVPACLSCSAFFESCVEDGLKISRHRHYMGRCGCQLCHLICCYLHGMKPQYSDFLVCTVCSKPFIARYFLIQHQKNCEKSLIRPKCDKCGLTLVTDSQMKQHKKSEAFCEKGSPAETNLKYKCDICWKSFSMLGALVLHRYTHIRVDEEMMEMENSLEVKTFQVNPENPIIIDDCEELIVIDVDREGEDNHSKTNEESGIADNEIKDGSRTHLDQNLNTPEEKENSKHLAKGQCKSRCEKICVDDRTASSEETESNEQLGTQCLQISQKCLTVDKNSEISSDGEGKIESGKDQIKTANVEEETEKESGLGNCLSEVENKEGLSDELMEDDDGDYILVSFDSSDEEDSDNTANHYDEADGMGNIEQGHDNSEDNEIPPIADLITRNNEVPSQAAELESTTMLAVSTSDVVMESNSGTDMNSAEGTSPGISTPQVCEVSMEAQQETSQKENNDENTDFEKMQPSLNFKIKETEEACIVKTESNTNIHSAHLETGETLEQNNSTESHHEDFTVTINKATALQDSSFSTDQFCFNQSGSKSHVKEISNEDGGEKPEAHSVVEDTIKTEVANICESSLSESAVTSDEISSTVPDDFNVDFPSNEGSMDKENMAHGILPPQNDGSLSKTSGETKDENMDAGEEATESSTLSDGQSDVGRNVVPSMLQSLLVQMKSENKEKCQKNEKKIAAADVICVSSDEEEENVQEKSIGGTDQGTATITDNPPINIQLCEFTKKALKIKMIAGYNPNNRLRNESTGTQASELNPSPTSTTPGQSGVSNKLNIVINLDPELDSYTCYLCNSKFPSVQSIQVHLRKVHSYFNNRNMLEGFYCCHCKDKFNSLEDLSVHESTVHGFEFSCPLCGIHQRDHDLFLAHIMDHLSPWVHYCVLCKLEFRVEEELKVHNAIEHGGKTVLSEALKCSICYRFFADKGKYYDHLRIVHGKLFKFTCKVCFQCFCTNSALKVHRTSLDNFLNGTRTKIAEVILIDASAVEVTVASEVPLSNFHRRYLSTPATSDKANPATSDKANPATSDKAKLTSNTTEQEPMLRKCSSTDTREGIVISDGNRKSLQNEGSADSNLESRRQSQSVVVTDRGTHGRSDAVNQDVASVEKSLPDIQCPTRSKTSASRITANHVTSTAESMVTNLKIIGNKIYTNVQGRASEELASNRGQFSTGVKCLDTSLAATSSTTSPSINNAELATQPFKNPEKRISILPTSYESGILNEPNTMSTSCRKRPSRKAPEIQTVDLTKTTVADLIEKELRACRGEQQSFVPIGNIMTIQPKGIQEKVSLLPQMPDSTENTVTQQTGKDPIILSFRSLVEKVDNEHEHKRTDVSSSGKRDRMPDSTENTVTQQTGKDPIILSFRSLVEKVDNEHEHKRTDVSSSGKRDRMPDSIENAVTQQTGKDPIILSFRSLVEEVDNEHKRTDVSSLGKRDRMPDSIENAATQQTGKDPIILNFRSLVEKVDNEHEHKRTDVRSLGKRDRIPSNGGAGECHSSQTTLRNVQNNENLPMSSSKSLNSSEDENIPVEVESVISNLLNFCKRPRMVSLPRESSNAVERSYPKVNSIPYKGAKGIMGNVSILQSNPKQNSLPVTVDYTTQTNLNVDKSTDLLRSSPSQEHSKTEEMDCQLASTSNDIKSKNFFVTKSVLSVLESNPSLLSNDWKESSEENGKGKRLRPMHPDLDDFIKLTKWKSSPLVLAKVNALLHKKIPIDTISRADTTRTKDGRITIGERKNLFVDIKNTLEKFEDDPQVKRNPINFENLDRNQCTKYESMSRKKKPVELQKKNMGDVQKTFFHSQGDLNDAVKRLTSVVQAIGKRKLAEYGPPDSTETQDGQPQKKMKVIPAKGVLNQDRVYVSVEGKIISDGNQPGSSSEMLNSRKLTNPSTVVTAHPVTFTQLSANDPQIDSTNTLFAEEGGMEFEIVKE